MKIRYLSGVLAVVCAFWATGAFADEVDGRSFTGHAYTPSSILQNDEGGVSVTPSEEISCLTFQDGEVALRFGNLVQVFAYETRDDAERNLQVTSDHIDFFLHVIEQTSLAELGITPDSLYYSIYIESGNSIIEYDFFPSANSPLLAVTILDIPKDTFLPGLVAIAILHEVHDC